MKGRIIILSSLFLIFGSEISKSDINDPTHCFYNVSENAFIKQHICDTLAEIYDSGITSCEKEKSVAEIKCLLNKTDGISEIRNMAGHLRFFNVSDFDKSYGGRSEVYKNLLFLLSLYVRDAGVFIHASNCYEQILGHVQDQFYFYCVEKIYINEPFQADPDLFLNTRYNQSQIRRNERTNANAHYFHMDMERRGELKECLSSYSDSSIIGFNLSDCN